MSDNSGYVPSLSQNNTNNPTSNYNSNYYNSTLHFFKSDHSNTNTNNRNSSSQTNTNNRNSSSQPNTNNRNSSSNNNNNTIFRKSTENNQSSNNNNNNNNYITGNNNINSSSSNNYIQIKRNSFGYNVTLEKYFELKKEFEKQIQEETVKFVYLISKSWLDNFESGKQRNSSNSNSNSNSTPGVIKFEKPINSYNKMITKITNIVDLNSKYLINYELDNIYKIKPHINNSNVDILNKQLYELLNQYFGGCPEIKRRLYYNSSRILNNNTYSNSNTNIRDSYNPNSLLFKYNLFIELNPLTIPITFMIKIDNEIDESSSFNMHRRMTDIAVFKKSTIFEFKLKILEILIKNNPEGLQYINFNAFIRLWKLYPENKQFYYSHFLPENRLKIINKNPVDFPGYLLDSKY